MKTNYSFQDLPIEVNPKALFQQSSHEASEVTRKKRIEILSRLVLLGYDLKLIVDDYLEIKDANEDIERINHITDSFNSYSDYILNGDGLYTSSRLKSQLKKSIENFEKVVKQKKSSSFSLEKLILAYIENDTESYEKQKIFWNIDIDEDISERIKKRDIDESTKGLWEYIALYEFFKISLLPQLRSNRIAYWEPSNQMPSSYIVNAFIKKFFPKEEHDKLKTDDKLRKNYLISFAKKVIEVLWFNKPLFEEPVYLIRCNYKNEPGKGLIPYFYERNFVSICIQGDENEHQQYYDNLISGAEIPKNNKLVYISRFVQIAKQVEQYDVIVVATYAGLAPKIGLIKKGTKIICTENQIANFYCLTMESVYCTPNSFQQVNTIDLTSYPILKSIIPQQVTISPVNKRKNIVYSIYYGVGFPVELNRLSESAIELMCMEWMRSDFAPDTFKIIYQIIKTGGNYADIDILGVCNEDKIVAGQVSYTDDINLVSQKINKLNAFDADKRMIFSMVYRPDLNYVDGCKNIFIEDVWNDFNSSSTYKKYIERLMQL